MRTMSAREAAEWRYLLRGPEESPAGLDREAEHVRAIAMLEGLVV